jgi:NitT/TauT family transport system ATP-binding protein
MSKSIAIEHLGVTYKSSRGLYEALRGINLHIDAGEFVCVVGPSGCGKTTLLNVLAGFLPATSGRVLVDGNPVTAPGPDRGVVFQQYAVFPWLTVRENVAFGLKLAANKKPSEEIAKIVDHYIDLVGLQDFQESFPKELSGGMRQRVAIARSYVVDPAVLLMDEPFGALDAQTRQHMQESLLGILAREKRTVVFITHAVEEAVFLADRVVVLGAGPGRVRKVVPVDLPEERGMEILAHPHFVALRSEVESLVREEFLDSAGQG